MFASDRIRCSAKSPGFSHSVHVHGIGASIRMEQVTFGPDGWAPGPRSQPAGLAVSSSPPGMGTPTAGRLPMTRASGPSKELHALVAWCRETRNPTVFWNKEDTPNYARLIATAKLFDHVFTRRRIANHLIRDLGPLSRPPVRENYSATVLRTRTRMSRSQRRRRISLDTLRNGAVMRQDVDDLSASISRLSRSISARTSPVAFALSVPSCRGRHNTA